MAILRYTASADTTITNAYKGNLRTRGTGSNMGLADSLEVFSIYGQESSGSSELSRILINFPVTTMITDRTAGSVPASGSVEWWLRMFNVKHSQTLPKDMVLTVAAVTGAWDEGPGLDMEEYSDLDVANWVTGSSTHHWTKPGGDFYGNPKYDVSFKNGNEDLQIDISDVVEQWIAGTKVKHGLGIYLTASQEAYFSSSLGIGNQSGSEGIPDNREGAYRSYYTKKFSSRGTQYYYSRPIIEARWNDSIQDRRNNFFASSSLVTGDDNLMTLYMYNFINGQLKNIASGSTGAIYLQLYTSASGGTLLNATSSTGTSLAVVTGGLHQTGIYSASFAMDTTASAVYDRWFDAGLSTCWHTGSEITVDTLSPSNYNLDIGSAYVTKITNLKSIYTTNENARFRIHVREKNWNPNLHTTATAATETTIIEKAYYKISRASDDLEVLAYGTGSADHTKLSYDSQGNYFDIDMSLLERDYQYKISFLYYVNGVYHEQPQTFNFRVE
tara:strand:+ start:188 stop:1687 length:1500 start_codon:yes stop_codon:yes gene_type:complete